MNLLLHRIEPGSFILLINLCGVELVLEKSYRRSKVYRPASFNMPAFTMPKLDR
jgi:hypothetical protein